MSDCLFDSPEHWTPHDLREKLLDAYAAELLQFPPVRSLTPEGEPDARLRAKNATTIARKDVRRAMEAIVRAGLTAEQVGQVIALYEGLKK